MQEFERKAAEENAEADSQQEERERDYVAANFADPRRPTRKGFFDGQFMETSSADQQRRTESPGFDMGECIRKLFFRQ